MTVDETAQRIAGFLREFAVAGELEPAAEVMAEIVDVGTNRGEVTIRITAKFKRPLNSGISSQNVSGDVRDRHDR